MFTVGALHQRINPTASMALAGVMIGTGMLAKYAAVYFAVGVVLFWVWQRRHRTTRPAADTGSADLAARQIGLLLAGMLLAASLISAGTCCMILPRCASWRQCKSGKAILQSGRKRRVSECPIRHGRTALFCADAGDHLASAKHESGPAVDLPVGSATRPDVTAGFVSEANANWALTAMPALVVWLSGWITRDGWRWGLLSVGINGGIALIFLVASSSADMGPLTPKSDPLRRLKGWSMLADDVDAALAASGTDRHRQQVASAALLNWHFYQRDITILIHDADNIPSNHFEANHPWRPQPGRHILMLSGTPDSPALDGVEWVGAPVLSDVVISDNRRRITYLHYGREQAAS